MFPSCSDSDSQTGATSANTQSDCSQPAFDGFDAQASGSGSATVGLLSGFSLQATGTSGMANSSFANAAAIATDTENLIFFGGGGSGMLALNFGLSGAGYEGYTSGTASMDFAVSANQSQLLNTQCPYDGGDFAGYECQQQNSYAGPLYFTVDVPFVFGQALTLTEQLTAQAQTYSGGAANALLSSWLASYTVEQNGSPMTDFTVTSPFPAPEPASFALGCLALFLLAFGRVILAEGLIRAACRAAIEKSK